VTRGRLDHRDAAAERDRRLAVILLWAVVLQAQLDQFANVPIRNNYRGRKPRK
jgi:hypothetical protein